MKKSESLYIPTLNMEEFVSWILLEKPNPYNNSTLLFPTKLIPPNPKKDLNNKSKLKIIDKSTTTIMMPLLLKNTTTIITIMMINLLKSSLKKELLLSLVNRVLLMGKKKENNFNLNLFRNKL